MKSNLTLRQINAVRDLLKWDTESEDQDILSMLVNDIKIPEEWAKLYVRVRANFQGKEIK
jgi:hypothetical protein